MLDQTFEALKTYDWGVAPKVLLPIDEAIVTSHGDTAARKELESRMAEALGTELPRAAKDALCRWLRTIGTATSVPALAGLLADKDLSHMARYALERIPGPEAGTALRKALPDVASPLRIGIIGSLGVRGEATSVEPFRALLSDGDPAIATSAARALGAIGSAEATKTLQSVKAKPATKKALADASLVGAERLVAAGRKPEARTIYQDLLVDEPTDTVKIAAAKGLEACQ